MSSPRWLIGIAIIWLVLTIFANVAEQTDILQGTTTGENNMTVLDNLLSYRNIESDSPVGSVYQGLIATGGVLTAIWQMLWFDYPMFTGGWVLVRYFFMCFTIAFFFGLAMMVIQTIRGG